MLLVLLSQDSRLTVGARHGDKLTKISVGNDVAPVSFKFTFFKSRARDLFIVAGLKVMGELFIKHLGAASMVLVVTTDSQLVNHLSDKLMRRHNPLLASQRAFSSLLEVVCDALLAEDAFAARALLGV